MTSKEIVEILTANNSDGEEKLQLRQKNVQILEKNINEGNPKEVTGKDGEDAFVNQNFREKDKTNNFSIESAKNCKWTKIIKEPKAVEFQKNICSENYAKAIIFHFMIYFSKSVIL